MFATELNPRPWRRGWWKLDIMAGLELQADDRHIQIQWHDNPGNTRWKRGPDGRDPLRREPVVRALVERFGKWED
jgi:hypothetical protein